MSVADDIKRIAAKYEPILNEAVVESRHPQMPSFNEYATLLNEDEMAPPSLQLDNQTLMNKWEKYWPMIKSSIRTRQDAIQLYVLLQQEILQLDKMNSGDKNRILNMRGSQLGDQAGFDHGFTGATKADEI